MQSSRAADKHVAGNENRGWPLGSITCRNCNGQHCSAGKSEPWRSSSHVRLTLKLSRSSAAAQISLSDNPRYPCVALEARPFCRTCSQVTGLDPAAAQGKVCSTAATALNIRAFTRALFRASGMMAAGLPGTFSTGCLRLHRAPALQARPRRLQACTVMAARGRGAELHFSRGATASLRGSCKWLHGRLMTSTHLLSPLTCHSSLFEQALSKRAYCVAV